MHFLGINNFLQAFAQGVVDFEPATTILTADEMEEAKDILSRKPDGLSHEQFEIIQRQILDGTPQVEFLLVRSIIFCLSLHC